MTIIIRWLIKDQWVDSYYTITAIIIIVIIINVTIIIIIVVVTMTIMRYYYYPAKHRMCIPWSTVGALLAEGKIFTAHVTSGVRRSGVEILFHWIYMRTSTCSGYAGAWAEEFLTNRCPCLHVWCDEVQKSCLAPSPLRHSNNKE